MTKETVQRRWMTWPSYNVFHCDGKLITGPDKMSFYTTLFLMIAPEIVWLAVVIPDLYDSVISGWTTFILVGQLYIFIAATVFLFITAFMDPGIIPRKSEEKINAEDPFAPRPPESRKIPFVDNTEFILKYCDTCNIYRPPRCTHCSVCNNCVDSFDHHCPWTGNCIGKRNYRYFLLFVYGVILNCLSVFGLCIVKLYLYLRDEGPHGSSSHSSPIGDRITSRTQEIATLVLAVYCVIVTLLVSILGGLHLQLLWKAETTNEHIKKTYRKKKNPFKRGVLGNYLAALCAPAYPRYINPREILDDSGEVSQGVTVVELKPMNNNNPSLMV